MKKLSKGSSQFVYLLVGCVFLMVVFVAIAILSGAWPGSDASAQIMSALAGSVVAAIITMFLLLGQTSSEEQKERNTKIFEEKLRVYQNFLHSLGDVVKDMKIEPEEEVELELQVAYIAMHTSSEAILNISEQVRDVVVRIKKGEDGSNEILRQLFVIADTFYKELYGEENLFKNDQRERTIANFDSILVANEDISQYEIEQKADVISSLNKDNNLSVEARTKLLQAMIDANGATQWIWNGTTLVHEFYTDISNKTGRLIKSKNRIAVDMTPIGREYYEVTVFSRQNSEDSAKKIAEGIWGKFMPWRNDNKTRHLYKKIAWNTDNREIAAIMSNLLQEIRRYRDRMITNN